MSISDINAVKVGDIVKGEGDKLYRVAALWKQPTLRLEYVGGGRDRSPLDEFSGSHVEIGTYEATRLTVLRPVTP